MICKEYSLAYEYVYSSDGLNCDGDVNNGYMSKYMIEWHETREAAITFSSTNSRRARILDLEKEEQDDFDEISIEDWRKGGRYFKRKIMAGLDRTTTIKQLVTLADKQSIGDMGYEQYLEFKNYKKI